MLVEDGEPDAGRRNDHDVNEVRACHRHNCYDVSAGRCGACAPRIHHECRCSNTRAYGACASAYGAPCGDARVVHDCIHALDADACDGGHGDEAQGVADAVHGMSHGGKGDRMHQDQ